MSDRRCCTIVHVGGGALAPCHRPARWYAGRDIDRYVCDHHRRPALDVRPLPEETA